MFRLPSLPLLPNFTSQVIFTAFPLLYTAKTIWGEYVIRSKDPEEAWRGGSESSKGLMATAPGTHGEHLPVLAGEESVVQQQPQLGSDPDMARCNRGVSCDLSYLF